MTSQQVHLSGTALNHQLTADAALPRPSPPATEQLVPGPTDTGGSFSTSWSRCLARLERLPLWAATAIAFAALGLLGLGDWLTGADVAFTAMYLVPIGWLGWFGRRRVALLFSAAASLMWFIIDFASRSTHSSWALVGWNVAAQLGVFFFAALTMSALRAALVEDRRALDEAHAFRLQLEQHVQRIERLSTVGKLASGIAHELGTPLNVVGSYAQMIESGRLAGEAAQSAAGIIRNQTTSMTTIVRQLVDFSRAGHSRRDRNDVRQLVAAACSVLAPMANTKQVTLAFDGCEHIEVEVDATRVQQAFMNVVVNAIQAVPEKTRVDITVGRASANPPLEPERRNANWVFIGVADQGPGVSPKVLPHLFEPFFTTKDVGAGSGLGLSVAYGIIREHGGWITAENLTPAGARFVIYLPAAGSTLLAH